MLITSILFAVAVQDTSAISGFVKSKLDAVEASMSTRATVPRTRHAASTNQLIPTAKTQLKECYTKRRYQDKCIADVVATLATAIDESNEELVQAMALTEQEQEELDCNLKSVATTKKQQAFLKKLIDAAQTHATNVQAITKRGLGSCGALFCTCMAAGIALTVPGVLTPVGITLIALGAAMFFFLPVY